MPQEMGKTSTGSDCSRSISPVRRISRKRVRHGKDDTNKAFKEIHPTPQSLRQQMIEIVRYKSQRTRARGWVSNMRFLVVDRPEQREPVQLAGDNKVLLTDKSSSSDGSVQSGLFPVCLKFGSRRSLPDPNAYVAVSYTWNREDSGWFEDLHVPPIDIVADGQPPRVSSVPPDVLHRSVIYAMHKNISAVWIDQECINQDDPQDKEDGIQAMDIVYEESRQPIAVLECYLDRQEHVDVLVAAVEGEEFEPGLIEALAELLEALLIDPWFSRAWTLQESISAGISMMLLIPCDALLTKPKYFGPTPGEIEISIFDLQNAMVHIRGLIEEGLAANVWEDEGDAIYASNCADNLWNFLPTGVLDTLDRAVSHRRPCYASEAITFLETRQNSFFPDRLAILANLCNYETRIDTKVLEDPLYSFSTCALTLAILNGDMSLLGGYGARGVEDWDLEGRHAGVIDLARDGRSLGAVFLNNDTDSPSSSYGFSWGPPPFGKLSDIAYEEDTNAPRFLLRPSTLSENGLRVRGIIWQIKYVVHVPRTKSAFVARWKNELEAQSDLVGYDREADIRGQPLSRDFVWALLHELFDLGLEELVKTLWKFFEPRGRTEMGLELPAVPRPYPFGMIFNSSKQIMAGGQKALKYDLKDVIDRLRIETLIVDAKRIPYKGPSMVRNLMDQICREGKLLCGGPLIGHDMQPRILFEACKEGDLIFTPSTEFGDRAADSPYRDQAMSWRVTQTGRIAEGCGVLHCLGRRRGFWRMEDLEATDYILD